MHQIVRLCAFVITMVVCFSAVNRVSAQNPVQAGQVIISELRFRGPAGAEDEFIELYNNTDSPIIVQASDTSPGWAVSISNGQITGNVCLIPNGTEIPARGHFLCANANGYSLSNYPAGDPNCGAQNGQNGTSVVPFGHATPDGIWDFDIPDGSGVGLFTTTSIIAQTAATRLDAFGFTVSPALYREGAGFGTIPTISIEHTLYRNLTSTLPKDTNDNAADFLLVGTVGSIQTRLNGSPGPENRCSPIQKNAMIPITVIDPTVSGAAPPNRERFNTPEPNANLGTLHFRRTLKNNTGQPITRLRFRVIDITTRGTCPARCADLRVLSSTDGTVMLSNGMVVTIRGVRLEENPPITPDGGGYNSSASVDSVTLTNPLMPGQSINVDIKVGVMAEGPFRVWMNIEALNGTPIVGPSTD